MKCIMCNEKVNDLSEPENVSLFGTRVNILKNGTLMLVGGYGSKFDCDGIEIISDKAIKAIISKKMENRSYICDACSKDFIERGEAILHSEKYT